jgi:hypothetical protein
MKITEGGNVFKLADGSEATGRINRADVIPTVKWLEQLTGLNLVDNMLGSTGYKETSGDLDLAVDASKISKDVLVQQLLKKGIEPADIKKTGDSVHFKTPINGEAKNGYVQTDFMFGDPSFQRFSMTGSPEGSPFKGMHRHVLLASIAKAQGMKWSYKNGLMDRATNEVVSKDPSEIAHKLFNGSAADLASVETILAKIKNLPNYNALVADARETLGKENVELPETRQEIVGEGSAAWFKNWKSVL